MADRDHENDKSIVFDSAQNAVIADAVTPKSFQRAAQRFADAARIGRNALFQDIEDTPLHRAIELRQLPFGNRVEFNRPARAGGGLHGSTSYPSTPRAKRRQSGSPPCPRHSARRPFGH